MKKSLSILQKIYLILKSIFEPLLALLLLIFLTPLFIIIAIAVKRNSQGGVFARKQIRIGENRNTFFMYKFRSMHEGYEKISPAKDFKTNMYKQEVDPRVTATGKFLRKTDLDELPQLINIFRGEMHLVGPRAFQPEEEKFYKKEYPQLRKLINYRCKVKPGLTGLWQIAGRNSTTLEERLKLDEKYVDRLNPILDIHILIQTIILFFTQKWDKEKKKHL